MLDYETKLPRYQSTPEDRRWLLRRLFYYLGHVVVLGLIGYWAGPNLIMFHSLFSPTPADYAAIAEGECTTAIAAIKAYQRDNGSLPSGTWELGGTYLPRNSDPTGNILSTTSVTFGLGRAVVEYEFTPAREGWFIHAPRYDGRLPAPIVPPSPTTRPAVTQGANANH